MVCKDWSGGALQKSRRCKSNGQGNKTCSKAGREVYAGSRSFKNLRRRGLQEEPRGVLRRKVTDSLLIRPFISFRNNEEGNGRADYSAKQRQMRYDDERPVSLYPRYLPTHLLFTHCTGRVFMFFFQKTLRNKVRVQSRCSIGLQSIRPKRLRTMY